MLQIPRMIAAAACAALLSLFAVPSGQAAGMGDFVVQVSVTGSYSSTVETAFTALGPPPMA